MALKNNTQHTNETSRQSRVVFFSKDDLASGYNLLNAEKLLINFDVEDLSNVNDLLEIYHIKLYFDNSLFLKTWSKTTKEAFIQTVSKAETKLKEFFLGIQNDHIINLLNEVDFDYKKSFWHLITYYKVFKKISSETFVEILKDASFSLGYVLQQKIIVDHFHQDLRKFLIQYSKTAEFLLTKYEELNDSQALEYFFPNSLSLQDKENIISSYIDANPNLNYIHLIEKSKDSVHLKISAKTKLKAKKCAIKLNKELFSDHNSYETGVEITLQKNQKLPVKYSRDGLILKVSYSEDYLDQQITSFSRLMLFKNLFEYVDKQGTITLISKQNELTVLERISIRSKNEYTIGFSFNSKVQLSILQLLIFDNYLKTKDSSIEKLVLSFIDEIFTKYFKLENLLFSIPSFNSTYLEKVRALAPELEFLMKQYHFYREDGNIDLELIQLDSTPVNFIDVKSLVDKKYLYSNHDKVKSLQYHFFSDQSMLFYVEPFRDKHSNFFSLITSEDVKLENFKSHQLDIVDQLIKEEYLRLEIDNTVKLNKDILIFMIGILYKNEVISYWHYPPDIRHVLDEMIKDGWLTVENTLLSKPELSYFNFHLNKKEFTNGSDIRNKYLHGTNNTSDLDHQYEYYILLKLLILILLKIFDDLMLKKEADKFQEN